MGLISPFENPLQFSYPVHSQFKFSMQIQFCVCYISRKLSARTRAQAQTNNELIK